MRRFAALLLVWFLIGGIPVLNAASGVVDGSLDLSKWDQSSSVALDGAWQFWPRSLPSDSSPPPWLLPVPGSWNLAIGGADGWGTYRLTIKLSDPPPADVALSLPLINSAGEVRWNDAVVWTAGTWGREEASYVPARRSGVVRLEPRPGPNVLEIRVSNWGDINAGLTESLHWGPLTTLLSVRGSEIILSVFLFGCLFIMGLYHLGVFAYRPSDFSPLWFGLIALLLGLRGLVYGPSYLSDLLPGLGWEVLMKVGYLTFSASALLFGLFIRDLFSAVVPRWFTILLWGGAGTYSVANLLLPAAWYTPALPWFQVYVGVLAVLVVWILLRAIRGRTVGAPLFLAGFVLFFLAALNDILKTNFFIATPFLASWGLLVFLVFQSLVLIRKFTSALADSERYARHLARLNTSLERFIPKEFLGFLQKNSILEVELGDHRQQPMAVMFVDIRDFTTLSESMTPEENFKFINSYLRRMGPVVRRFNGFVDKYQGDGIMALFPGEVNQALDAAQELRTALIDYNAHRQRCGYVAIRMGLGIHWGVLMLGTIGETQRMDSTVISDTVNAASRLEGLTKKFSRDILVSGETVEALGEGKDRYQLEYLGEETVKGRFKPLKVYSLA